MATRFPSALAVIWFSSLMYIPTLNATQVFVSRDAAGNLIFSDMETPQAETHRIQPLPTIPALKYQKADVFKERKPDQAVPVSPRADTFQYQFLTILYPRDQDNLPPGPSATLEIMAGVKPRLRPKDTLVLIDNGKEIYSGRSLNISAANLDPGQHLLQLAIKRPNGDTIQESDTITVYIQRYSTLRNQATNRTK